MKKSMFLICMILLIAVSIAYAGVLKGKVTAMSADKSSLSVISDKDKKEYNFECAKGVIPSAINIQDKVIVIFKEEGSIKKAKSVRPDIGC